MKFFRDERGEATILAPWFGFGIRRKETDQPGLNEALAQTAPIVAAALCKMHCAWCGSEQLLPHAELGYAFGNPEKRRMEARSVGSVCGVCHHVSGFSMFRGNYGYDTRNMFVDAVVTGRTLLLDWLRCNEPTCAQPLPLFLHSDEQLDGIQIHNAARGWLWNDLTCAQDHPIAPPAWVYDRSFFHLPPQFK